MDAMIIRQGGAGTYERFLDIVRAIVGPGLESQSMIDLFSHVARLTRRLPFARSTFVDIGNYVSEFAGLEFVHADVIHGDHEVLRRQYDVALCLDGIEHVHKPEGRILLQRMQGFSRKQILFTPLDPWMVDETATNPEAHKCCWKPDELPDWAHIVLPEWHPLLGIGAFFFWQAGDAEATRADYERVKAALGG